jgi:hypothetical protein
MKTNFAFMRVAAVAMLACVTCANPGVAAQSTPNDAARILAGLAPAPNSPLAHVAEDAGWKRHAKFFDAAWDKLDKRQLTKVRAWQAKNMPSAQAVMFYMFSGPDFLYADAFFPNAGTYVMSGLEPIGTVPEIADIPSPSLSGELRQLQTSMNSVMAYSFFITDNMRTQLRAGKINGTLPVLYVFLARSGKTIDEVSFVDLDQDGAVQPEGKVDAKLATKGVRIAFSGADGRKQTLYYFTTDISNAGLTKNGAFLKFCDKLGAGDSFLKSASYLMHSSGFSTIRDFLLDHSMAVLQDDSGIPVQYFKGEDWELRPYGRYLGPISLFRGNYQAQLAKLFKAGKSPALDFGVGYRWRTNESNMLLAVKKPKAAEAGTKR